MPEYLSPGVYVEEVSFRSKSIEGVATSTTGFAGLTRWGPVCYGAGLAGGLPTPAGPRPCEPRLITSFVEFERVYGGLEPLQVDVSGTVEDRIGYLAHAAKAFFDNGGRRLYVSRVFAPHDPDPDVPQDEDWGVATLAVPLDAGSATWRARWPGRAGKVRVQALVVRSRNTAVLDRDGNVVIPRAKAGTVIEVLTTPTGNDPLSAADLRVVEVNASGVQQYLRSDGTPDPLGAGAVVHIIELTVRVTFSSDRVDEYTELAGSPLQKRFVGRILEKDDPQDEDAVVWLDYAVTPVPAGTDARFLPAELLRGLRSNPGDRLTGGNDGLLPRPKGPNGLEGRETDPDHPENKATGLAALGEIEDIAIVAAPDASSLASADIQIATDVLITHAENLHYRIAVVDGKEGSSMNEIRQFRGQFDSYRAALYHPWIEILDPTERAAQGAPPRKLLLPPSGFVAGIYARNDISRGVHKAPANEVVRGLTRFEANINKGRQDVLNPEGINALRFFEGRGHRVWGARTMSSDPEWKYVNVIRLFLFLEHSIDRGTQWAVFEPNNSRLWANIRRTIEDFLLTLWRDGALLGAKPEEAFFVRCDRTTMTQNDLDNGRLICLIGVAPVKPAEFVIFRIGQWTADAKV